GFSLRLACRLHHPSRFGCLERTEKRTSPGEGRSRCRFAGGAPGRTGVVGGRYFNSPPWNRAQSALTWSHSRRRRNRRQEHSRRSSRGSMWIVKGPSAGKPTFSTLNSKPMSEGSGHSNQSVVLSPTVTL